MPSSGVKIADTPPAASTAVTLKSRVRLCKGDEIAMGPGKAELLERIRDTGSISAAGRQMTMSYKRAWKLVEEMTILEILRAWR